jgi:hypothetical protein
MSQKALRMRHIDSNNGAATVSILAAELHICIDDAIS